MPDLKLIALDADDLGVLSAHLQDAVVRLGDVVYETPNRRFAMLLNRFDWVEAHGKRLPGRYARRRSGLRFERVSKVRSVGIDRADSTRVLALLAVSFTPAEPPSGRITLHFSGGPMIELDVECIEGELRDLGAAWQTVAKPRHPDGKGG
ncbi:MAG: DUF2948 family protein [Hyphomicrobiaceae bacterium]|nr:DUF2948 family protein [Hyphomicrobiaceae bacterium]